MIAAITKAVRTAWLRFQEAELSGFELAGNHSAALDAAARIALIKAELRSLGGEDDDEDGADDDCKWKQIDPRDDYERVEQGSDMEWVGGVKP